MAALFNIGLPSDNYSQPKSYENPFFQDNQINIIKHQTNLPIAQL